MRKNYKFLVILIAVVLIIVASYFIANFAAKPSPVACPADAKKCPDGSFVARVLPSCDFAPCPEDSYSIVVNSPQNNEEIMNPVEIRGQAKNSWFFEGQFYAILYDTKGKDLGRVTLFATQDWLKEGFVPFEGKLEFSAPATKTGTLKFFSDNPSGLPENQKVFELPVKFALKPISLYYYQSAKDLDDNGNVKCSRDGLVAIGRNLPISQTPIKDTINLLLKGKENLTASEIQQGITTEYPLEGFSLTGVSLKNDGTLVLSFNDPFNKTSGGACRSGILWFQIETTAKQFPEVKNVEYRPLELFQP